MITKYKSKKTIINWMIFDSQLEARFYKYFIDNPKYKLLDRQIKFILQDKFTYNKKSYREIVYIADFKIEYEGDIYYVDSKWMKTDIFLLKYKLWLKRYWDENILIICKSIKELEEKLEKWEN